MKRFFKTMIFSFAMILGLMLAVSCDDVPTELPTELPTLPAEHEHVITEDKWYRDSAVHWKECSECDELIDMDAHAYGEWVKSETECKETKTCTVCGFAKTQTVKHSFVDGICSVCGQTEADLELVQYYVRGTGVGTWDAIEANALKINRTTYTATITVHMEKDTQFKIADASWTDGFNFGYGNANVTYDEGLFGNNDGDNFLVLNTADYIITVSGLDGTEHKITIKAGCLHVYGSGKLVEGKTCDYVKTCSNCGLEQKYTEHFFEDDDLVCDLCSYYDFKVYYVKGSFNNFETNEDFKLEYDETTFTATIDLLLTVGHTFKIATDDWSSEFAFDSSVIPTGSFVADKDNNFVCVASTPSGEDVLFHVTITGMNTVNQKISITTAEEYVVNEVEGTVNPSDLYVKGTMTEWAESEDYQLSIIDNVASITVDLTAGDEFKIANPDWSNQYHLLNVTCTQGLFDAAGDDAAKPNMKVKTTGTYKIEVVDGKCTITLINGDTPTPNPNPNPSLNLPVLYLRGTLNEWSATEAYLLKENDNTLSLTTALYSGQEFKIATADWTTEINYKGMTSSADCLKAGTDEKPNAIVLKDGVYKVTVSGTTSNMTCTVEFVSDIKCTSENGEHTFADATCETPKTCSVCQYAVGEALGHQWDEGTTEGTKIVYSCTRTDCTGTKEVETDKAQVITIYFDIDWDSVSQVYLNGVKMDANTNGNGCEFVIEVQESSITTLDLDFEQNGAWFHVVDSGSSNFVESSTTTVSMAAGKTYKISGVTWRHDNSSSEKFFSVTVTEVK